MPSKDQRMKRLLHVLHVPVKLLNLDSNLSQALQLISLWLYHPGGALSTYPYRGGGSVQEIFRQPKNINSASMQPKNISSLRICKPVHEHKLSPNNANRNKDCLHQTQKYQYNDFWYKNIMNIVSVFFGPKDITFGNILTQKISDLPPRMCMCRVSPPPWALS